MSAPGWLTLTGVLAVCYVVSVACLPLEHSKQNRVGCMYENKTYESGEKFRPDPCTFCHCPRHGGRVQCAVQDCLWEPSCVRRKLADDGCCGTCLQYGCKNHDGEIYRPRELISSTPCEQCYCPPGGGAVECVRPECPAADCVNPVQEEGECCPTCPDGPNCWLEGEVISPGVEVKIDNCRKCHCPRHPEKWPQFMRKKGLQAVCSTKCR